MSDILASLHTWLIEPLEPEVASVIQRLRRAPDVRRVAIMPDVHLANDVTIGTVLATDRLLYPQAVGGDIGCGMLAVALDASEERTPPTAAVSRRTEGPGRETAGITLDPTTAGAILRRLTEAIPSTRHHRRATIPFPDDLHPQQLSHPSLTTIAKDEGTLQLGTLGSGNHFVELQSDDDDRLWLMIHSGSRAMGQAIRAHHLARAEPMGSNLKALDATSEDGRAYANDVEWARRYADANRRAIASATLAVLSDLYGFTADCSTLVTVDHNHVAREEHDGATYWVHRKGAMPAAEGSPGVLPGSMGTLSYHVEGKGHPDSLRSSAHGAGRSLSREKARAHVTERDLHRQLQGIWYDYRSASHLREEAPAAYKDVRAVLRAQRDLVKVTRTLRPLLSFKCR